jgi:hypothetical protein
VQRHDVRGLIVTGGFVTLFNPGVEAKVADHRVVIIVKGPRLSDFWSASSHSKPQLALPSDRQPPPQTVSSRKDFIGWSCLVRCDFTSGLQTPSPASAGNLLRGLA